MATKQDDLLIKWSNSLPSEFGKIRVISIGDGDYVLKHNSICLSVFNSGQIAGSSGAWVLRGKHTLSLSLEYGHALVDSCVARAKDSESRMTPLVRVVQDPFCSAIYIDLKRDLVLNPRYVDQWYS